MAHKKGLGSSSNGRDSNPQYLGIKRYGGESVNAGDITPGLTWEWARTILSLLWPPDPWSSVVGAVVKS